MRDACGRDAKAFGLANARAAREGAAADCVAAMLRRACVVAAGTLAAVLAARAWCACAW